MTDERFTIHPLEGKKKSVLALSVYADYRMVGNVVKMGASTLRLPKRGLMLMLHLHLWRR